MKKLFAAFLLFIVASVQGQDFNPGKVSVEELRQKAHPSEPDVAAAVLYKKGNSYLDISGVAWILVTEVEVRLKIYTVKGLSYAHVSVPYHIYPNGAEEVLFSNAVTYNLSGNRVVKTKLKELNGFIEDVDNNDKVKKIVLPNVEEGSIIEYKYIIKSPNIAEISNWRFREAVPVNFAEYSIAVPKGFEYDKKTDSLFDMQVSQKSYRRNIQLEIRKMTFNEEKTTYTSANVSALEVNPNESNNKIPVKYELIKVPGADDFYERYGIDWDYIAQNVMEDVGRDISKTSYFTEDIDQVLKGKDLREDRINAVFAYLRDRMAWDEYLGYTSRGEIDKAYKDKTGNAGAINLMLVAMLQYAGYNAYPVVVNTRRGSRGRYDFNYVIAGVESQSDTLLLDATCKSAIPGILPLRAINGKGRLIRKDFSHAEISLAPVRNSPEFILIKADILADGSITGQVKSRMFDYNALMYREANPLISEPHIREEYIGEKEKALNGIKIDSFNVTNMKEFNEPVEESFNFKGGNLCSVMDDKMYLSPMLMYRLAENPFKADERDTPVYFVFPYQEKLMVSINIPQGYTVEFVPQPLSIATRDDISSFKYNVAVSGSQIQMAASLDINYTKLGSEYYETLKEFYAKVIEKQSEKIILKKTE